MSRDARLVEFEAQLLRDPLNAPSRLAYARLLLELSEPVAALEVKWPAEREVSITRPAGGHVIAQQTRVGDVAVTYALE